MSDPVTHAEVLEALRQLKLDLANARTVMEAAVGRIAALKARNERLEEALADAGGTDPDREPDDPDGECFRGGEAAAYEAEEQARIQRDLK